MIFLLSSVAMPVLVALAFAFSFWNNRFSKIDPKTLRGREAREYYAWLERKEAKRAAKKFIAE